VTVDGVTYRWRESHGHRAFELRIEHFARCAQLLVVTFPYLHLDRVRPDNVYRPIMTHRVLAAVVERGLALGWRPERKAPQLAIDGTALVTSYDYRHSKWTVRAGDRYV
jgi:hypothetical protein